MKIKKIFIFSLLIIVTLTLSACSFASNNQSVSSDKIKVAATIYPLYDIVKNIGGDKTDVVLILPPGASPHTFELKPSDVKNMENSQAVFEIGLGLDDWATDLADSIDNLRYFEVNDKINLLDFESDEHEHGDEAHESEGAEEEHHHEGQDPHYWLSLGNAGIIAGNVAEDLSELDPANADYYAQNLSAYQEALTATTLEAQSILDGLSKKDLVVFHDSWNYFAQENGLNILAVFEPSPGKEPTPQQLAEFNDLILEHQVKSIFSEPQLSQESIKAFIGDLDLNLYVLDPLGGVEERDSYIKNYLYNVRTIKQALEK